MPNPLTGEFDAVLQVSGGTVNRLVASLHQNAGANSNLPSHPHSVSLRLGDAYAIDGVRGWMDAQLGVPRIELMNGATDHFNLEVDVRAHYLADVGSTPIPEFVVGVVRAQYKIQDIDPNCPGWKNRARDYLWFRVVKDSVSFTGTATDDLNSLVIVNSIVDEAGTNARITRQIAELLATQFEAAPHKVSRHFRAGSMCSLAAPIGGSAVALPISLSGGEPVGEITSLKNLFLDDHDFAIALRSEVFMGMVEPMLAELRALSLKYVTTITPFIGPSYYIHHTARVTSATAAWEATGGDHATLRITAQGVVDSDTSLAPDIEFQVNQAIWIYFDSTGETLTLTAPDPGVSVQAQGIFATQKLTDSVSAGIKSAVKARTQALPSIPVGGRAELVTQLATLDDMAGANFQDAVFTTYGVVMRGRVWLSPRRGPVVQFHVTAKEDGFSAYEAWAPGGRIDRFIWSWTWTSSRPGDSATRSDRFILRRPRVPRSKWGGSRLGGTAPLPGIDGFGTVCLTLSGVQVNPITGSLDSFTTSHRCTRYGISLGVPVRVNAGRLVQKLWHEVDTPGSPPVEVGLLEVGGYPVDFASAANTLIVHFGERFDPETIKALEEGLAASRRDDAGLVMIALFRHGIVEGTRHRIVAEVDKLAEGAGLPAEATEDVDGAWRARFAIPPDNVAFRLITPGGGLTWMHDGPVTGDNLARALDDHLRKSPPARPVAIRPTFEKDSRLPALALRPGNFTPVDDNCPPHPLGRLGPLGAVVAFVHGRAASSGAQLAAIAGRKGFEQDDAPLAIAIVDGDARVAAAMMAAHPGLVALADPLGSLAKRFGIRVWPTTLNINGDGVVANYTQGLETLGADERQRQDGKRPPDGEERA